MDFCGHLKRGDTPMAREMQLWKPSITLSIEQEAAKSKAILQCATSRLDALKQAKRLIQSWPHANPPDPVGYAQAIAETLAQFPLGLVEECCDPRTGLAREREFPPTVAAVVDWCNRRLTYHRGMVKWAEQKAVERPEFPEEYRRSMLKRLQDLLHGMFKQPVAEEKL
jgi:hypothetical protein